ncbi:tRNA N(3)-methylcytidine methyltransferase METTL2 [Nematocida sp. AWRm77]|nr:tRNA N(3)-methylcytidine methyltransferase METTL2 [Nematocida sp. AWRm77]
MNSNSKGTRELTSEEDKFKHNAWDKVSISEEKIQEARMKIQNDETHIPAEHKEVSYEPWNAFYKKHRMSFFQERAWITKEFPELLQENKRVFEVGCGTGSSLSQIIQHSTVFGIDYSTSAISIIKHRPGFSQGTFQAHNAALPDPFPYKDQDYILMIFTLSAIDPKAHPTVFRKIKDSLSPGGVLLFRDYGYMDLTQLRFKPEQILDKNFYQRGEGTCAYFFTEEAIRALAQNAGLEVIEYKEDKRLLINRKKKLEMQRSWIQARFRKPEHPEK